MNRSVLVLSGLTLFAAAAADAGPLNRAWVAKDAQWVVHLDAEAAMGSTAGRFAMANKADLDLSHLDRFKEQTGIDPFSDIKGLTVYGHSADPQSGIAVISTTSAVDGLVERMQAKDKSLQKLTEGKYTLFTWSEHGEPRFGQIRRGQAEGDRVVLVAADKSVLLAGIRVMDGDAASLPVDPKPAAPGQDLMSASPKAGSIFFAIATNLDSAQAMPFAKAKGVVVDIGEADAQLFADLTVIPRDSENVTDLMQVMQGAVAMVRMAAAGEPQLAELSKIAQGIAFDSDGKQITASLRYSTDGLLKSLIAFRNSQRESREKPTSRPVGNNADNEQRGR